MPMATVGTIWPQWDTQSRRHRRRTLASRQAHQAFTRRHTVRCQCQCPHPEHSHTPVHRCPHCQANTIAVPGATLAFNCHTDSLRTLCPHTFPTYRAPIASTQDQHWDGILAAEAAVDHQHPVWRPSIAAFMIQLKPNKRPRANRYLCPKKIDQFIRGDFHRWVAVKWHCKILLYLLTLSLSLSCWKISLKSLGVFWVLSYK